MKQLIITGALIAFPFASAVAAPFDDLVQSMPASPQDLQEFVSETTEVLTAVVWNADGQVVFPPAATEGRDAVVFDHLDELRKLSQEAGTQGVTVPGTIAPDRIFHCRQDPALCLILDAEAIGGTASDPLYDPYYAYFESAMGWFYIIIGLCMALVIGFYFVVRSRPEIPLDPEGFVIGPLEVYPSRRNCVVDGQEHPLTARDITLLRCFEGLEGGVVARESLLDAGWGESHRPSADALDQHLQELGVKLGHPQLFVQGVGQGYRIAD